MPQILGCALHHDKIVNKKRRITLRERGPQRLVSCDLESRAVFFIVTQYKNGIIIEKRPSIVKQKF